MCSPRFLRRRVGRRGAFLLFLALLDFLYGYSLLEAGVGASALHLDLVIAQNIWAWWWLSTGLACLLGAFVVRDRMFFAVAASLKAAWAAVWINVWIQDPLVPRAWVSVAIWGAFAGVVMLIAGWPEVRRVQPPPGDS